MFGSFVKLRLLPLGLALVFLFSLVAASLTVVAPSMAEDGPERRIALVIGNSAYKNAPALANPANDARLIASTLAGLGFTLIGDGPLLDLERPAMEGAIRDFGQQLRGGAVGLFYYSGHGIQVRGSNFLVPVSANVTQDSDVKYELVDVGFVLDEMSNAGNRLNIVILDACRNNPFGGRGLRALSPGLGQVTAPAGTVISYATQPNNVALDGAGQDSPFTSALATELKKPGQNLFATFNAVGLDVKRATGGQQQPWLSVSPIEGQFSFSGRPDEPAAAGTEAGQTPAADAAGSPQDPDALFWNSVKNNPGGAEYRAYLSRFPNGQFASLAQHRLDAECEDAARGAGEPVSGTDGSPPNGIDAARAIAACEAAPESPRIDYLLGRALEAGKRFEDAAKAYRRAADKEPAPGAYFLGALYEAGRGVDKDPAEAARWYKTAAEQGFVPAELALGGLFERGLGVTRDEAEATRWYRRSAEQGDARGQVATGRMYSLGRGVARDETEAASWYRKAALQGDAMAEYRLGEAYARGQGVAADNTEAANWYRKAALQGNAAAQCGLGWSYQYGLGVPRDETEAANWYRKAALQGNEEARSYLATLGKGDSQP